MSLVNATTALPYSQPYVAPVGALSSAASKGSVESVQAEMAARNSNIGGGIGTAIRGVWDWIFGSQKSDEAVENPTKTHTRTVSQVANNTSVPFSTYYAKLFPQATLNVFYVAQDAVVDDGIALSLLLAAQKSTSSLPSGKKIVVLGVNACAGYDVCSQAELNTLQYLELTQSQKEVLAYRGSRAPLALGNDTEAITKLEEQINATHYFGYDGQSDVGDWKNVSTSVQPTPGYLAAAAAVAQATPDNRVNLISTGPLTEVFKTLSELLKNDPSGAFAQNINALSIQGGCLIPGVGCNAPYFKPDNQKDSELSFYFDVPAAQGVFEICQKYGIPIILSELGFTRQPGLSWTKVQVSTLEKINNPVTQQQARVTNIIPYPFARGGFKANQFPVDAFVAMAADLWPELCDAIKVAITIGDVGQMTVNETAPELERNVYILSMSEEKQAIFYDTVLKEYENFNCLPGTTSDKCKQAMPLSTLLEIVIPAGVGAIGLTALIIFGIVRSRRKSAENESLLQAENRRLLKTVGTLQEISGLGLRDADGQLLPHAVPDPDVWATDDEQ